MREATIDTPRRVAPNRHIEADRSRWGAVARVAMPVLRLLGAHPGKALAGVAFAVMLGGIVTNAVVLQNGRHPAPLFGSTARTGVVPDHAANIPLPAARPATDGGNEAQVVPPRAQAGASSPPRGVEPAAQARQPDEIGHLLRIAAKPPSSGAAAVKGNDLAPAPRPRHGTDIKPDTITRLLRDGAKAPPVGAAPSATGAVTPKVADALVLNAQRTLVKLGYVVQADGHMGQTTRQAIAKFERDRHRPVESDVTPKLLRELGSATKFPPR